MTPEQDLNRRLVEERVELGLAAPQTTEHRGCSGPKKAPKGSGTRRADNLRKAKEILRDYDAGRSLEVIGIGWLVRFAMHIVESEGAK